MAKVLRKTSDYQLLKDELQALLDDAREQVLATVNKLRMRTYWKIGKRLHASKTVSKKGSELMQRLAEDLHLAPSVLYRALQFFRAYPKGIPKNTAADQLGWTAHLELLPIKDPKEREFYLKQAVASGWSRDILRQAIRGELYADKKKSGNGSGKTKHQLKRPAQSLHTYLGEVTRVVDGDTLICRIDLGFDVWKLQRIRLRGIDTPSRDTPEGKKALRFVEQQLAKVEFVVIKTYQVDMYYRYVADVFYHPKLKRKESVFNEGMFLNEALLKKKLAVLVF